MDPVLIALTVYAVVVTLTVIWLLQYVPVVRKCRRRIGGEIRQMEEKPQKERPSRIVSVLSTTPISTTEQVPCLDRRDGTDYDMLPTAGSTSHESRYTLQREVPHRVGNISTVMTRSVSCAEETPIRDYNRIIDFVARVLTEMYHDNPLDAPDDIYETFFGAIRAKIMNRGTLKSLVKEGTKRDKSTDDDEIYATFIASKNFPPFRSNPNISIKSRLDNNSRRQYKPRSQVVQWQERPPLPHKERSVSTSDKS